MRVAPLFACVSLFMLGGIWGATTVPALLSLETIEDARDDFITAARRSFVARNLGEFLHGVENKVQDVRVTVTDASKKVEAFVAGISLPTYSCAIVDEVLAYSGQGETLKTIRSFATTVNTTVLIARRVERVLQEAWKGDEVKLDQFARELGGVARSVLLERTSSFLVPQTVRSRTNSHEEREKAVTAVLAHAERGVLDLATTLGLPIDKVQELQMQFEELAPFVTKLVVTAGDIVEQHPVLFKLVMFIAHNLIPRQLWFLWLLLSPFGFGAAGQDNLTSEGLRLFWNILTSNEDRSPAGSPADLGLAGVDLELVNGVSGLGLDIEAGMNTGKRLFGC